MEFVKQAKWLGRERVVSYARLISLIYIPGLIFLLLVAVDLLPVRRDATGTDFISFWTAGRLVIEGGNPYDFPSLAALQGGSKYAFLYPPPFLLMVMPFSILPYWLALLAWIGAGIAAFVAMARKLVPSIWPVIAFPPLLINAAHGQNGAITAALFIGAAVTIDRRPFLAGMLLGCFIIKPHLALLFPIAFLLGRKWAVVFGGATSALLCCAASFLLLGSDAWVGFLTKGPEATALLEHNEMLLPKMVSVFGMLRAPGAPLWLAYGVQVAVSLAAACAVAYAAMRKDTGFTMAVLATGAVLATPFIYSYDLTLLFLPIAWLAHDGMNRGFKDWTKAIMVVAFMITLFDRSMALLIGFNPAFLTNGLLMFGLFHQRK
jgi:hypothetical protein